MRKMDKGMILKFIVAGLGIVLLVLSFVMPDVLAGMAIVISLFMALVAHYFGNIRVEVSDDKSPRIADKRPSAPLQALDKPPQYPNQMATHPPAVARQQQQPLPQPPQQPLPQQAQPTAEQTIAELDNMMQQNNQQVQQQQPQQQPQQKQKPVYNCPYCNEISDNEHRLNMHIISRHKDQFRQFKEAQK